VLFLNGWGVPRDPSSAASWFERAAKQGREESKQFLRDLATKGVPEATAALHRLGLDAPLRVADAAVVAAGGCPLGDLAAQDTAFKSWRTRSFTDTREAAERGDLAAQAFLGLCFYVGFRGCPKDDAQALVWFRRAALGNVANALGTMGALCNQGTHGLPVHKAEAARYFSLAAAQGDGDAERCLLEIAAAGVPEAVAAARRLGLAP